ncbi:hypothetical protein KFK09_014134 [Dendrobium nobile]|uniref:Uncharacterized protein n=1 Tax=Dendrobium nobile TaxID=94219 RepID=A0A8T3B934_DENNO|nr:hypothetical protein KFK09_014134 [Dendrobium nobile]
MANDCAAAIIAGCGTGTTRFTYLSQQHPIAMDLLWVGRIARADKGNYVIVNYIWDMLQSRKVNASFPAMEPYYKGLMARPIAPDDPRILKVSRIYEDLSMRFGCRRNSNF